MSTPESQLLPVATQDLSFQNRIPALVIGGGVGMLIGGEKGAVIGLVLGWIAGGAIGTARFLTDPRTQPFE